MEPQLADKKDSVDTKALDLIEWEDLFRHPYFKKVTDVLSQRIESTRNTVNNRAKKSMGINETIESAGDLRVIAELEKVLLIFESLKQQILQSKGVNNG